MGKVEVEGGGEVVEGEVFRGLALLLGEGGEGLVQGFGEIEGDLHGGLGGGGLEEGLEGGIGADGVDA